MTKREKKSDAMPNHITTNLGLFTLELYRFVCDFQNANLVSTSTAALHFCVLFHLSVALQMKEDLKKTTIKSSTNMIEFGIQGILFSK